MTSNEAYHYALINNTKPNFNLEYYQEIACETSWVAYYFAKFIPGANIKYCQERACKNGYFAIFFAEDIPGANIEYCRKACEHDPYWLDKFDKMIIKKAML